MSAFDIVMKSQLNWAKHRSLNVDANGYLQSVPDNLFSGLSDATLREFEGGAGNELIDRPGKPAKMRALHSSSALVCNVFDYWRNKDRNTVARAFLLQNELEDLQFEAQLPTGLPGTPPTLDLLLVASKTLAWGVESKFTEPFQEPSKEPFKSKPSRVPFADSYFDNKKSLWLKLGLPKCQTLAEQLYNRDVEYKYLDAAQLLKHVLGLRRKHLEGKLLLLWFNVDDSEARGFEEEIREFQNSIDETLAFRDITYQQVFEHLSSEAAAESAYMDYNRSRYFSF